MSAVGSLVVVTVLSVMLAFYFLRDGGRLWSRSLARVRPEAAGAVDAAGSRAFEVLSGYMIGTGAISLVGATSQLVIMVLLGIPLALPIFVLSFFLCFIPYIGGFISTGLALLVTIAIGSPTDVAIMLVWTIVFNLVTGNIVSPLVYGKTVHLHPAVVLVAIPAGSAIAGIVGMFLVVPVIGVVAAIWRTVLEVIEMPRLAAGTRRRWPRRQLPDRRPGSRPTSCHSRPRTAEPRLSAVAPRRHGSRHRRAHGGPIGRTGGIPGEPGELLAGLIPGIWSRFP